MSVRILEDKVFLIQSAKTHIEAFTEFTRLIAEYGYENGAYILMNDHPAIGQVAHDGIATPIAQDWLNYYSTNKFRSADPVWMKLLKRAGPFFWSESELADQLKRDQHLSEAQRNASLRVIHECAEAGHVDGAAISLVHPTGEIACICIARSTVETNRSYEELAEISLLATSFHERYRSLCTESDPPRLTRRECEVLLHAAEGKADFDISCILNVSASTVRFHWNNIFGKLEVNGRLRAVVRAMQLRIISPQNIRPQR